MIFLGQFGQRRTDIAREKLNFFFTEASFVEHKWGVRAIHRNEREIDREISERERVIQWRIDWREAGRERERVIQI
ncbi:hypothetical protein GIB67_031322 [Kingdonia uniflora]|uniref:Uncharacterized protein n=1 Tax=Kingdonia uniflora TaxID=39325 RepID=A0A7J7M5N4_9MAGN|nr:hypothetical protein GIB67_031322 [Kingdonia uniflora]